MRLESLPPRTGGADRLSPTPQPAPVPDVAFAARPRLLFLRHALAAEARPRFSRHSGEPPVFFFDPARQAELEAARPRPSKEPHALEGLIADTLAGCLASVEVRRAARAIPGLYEAANAVAPGFPAAKELAEVLALPDDETILVLHPERRAGYRLLVRGVADVAQFHVLLADAVTGDADDGWLPGMRLPFRFAAACRDADPVIPAGVPMLMEPRWQLFQPSAVRADGSVPGGFRGCRHWLWGEQPLAAVERIDGERVIVLGEPEIRSRWEVTRRFPQMPAEARLLDVLSPFQVAERLGRLAGQPVPVRIVEAQPVGRIAKAA